MRTLPLLLTTLVLAASTHADTIDDFVLTGQGHTIEYSVPATTSTPDYDVFNFFSLQSSATIDGVSGYNVVGLYYVIFPGVDLVLDVPSSVFGTSSLAFGGAYLYSYTLVPADNPQPYLPYNVVATFTPGTYSLRLHNSSSQPPDLFDPPPPPVYYTLTITPEAETAATPEPSTLALFLTGGFGLLAFVCIRGLRRQVLVS